LENVNVRIEIVKVDKKELPESIKKGIRGKIFRATLGNGNGSRKFSVSLEEAEKVLDPEIITYLREEIADPGNLRGLTFSEDEVKVTS
jgi:hypothetical protein